MSDAFDWIMLGVILVAVVASAIALVCLIGVKSRLGHIERDLRALKQARRSYDDLADLYPSGADVEAHVVAEMTRSTSTTAEVPA